MSSGRIESDDVPGLFFFLNQFNAIILSFSGVLFSKVNGYDLGYALLFHGDAK